MLSIRTTGRTLLSHKRSICRRTVSRSTAGSGGAVRILPRHSAVSTSHVPRCDSVSLQNRTQIHRGNPRHGYDSILTVKPKMQSPTGPLHLLLASQDPTKWISSSLQDRTFSTQASSKTDPPTPTPRPPSPRPPQPRLSRTIGRSKIPTPASAPPASSPLQQLREATPKSIVRKGLDLVVSVFKTVMLFLLRLPGKTWFYLTHPNERKERVAAIKKVAQEELHHYWMGTKLLWADIQTARNLLSKTLSGSALSRRERKQLLRTVSDLFRLVPFSMFIIIPFMEFALPFALRIFPNLLPSTFQDSLKHEELMKRELQSRIAMTQFFQETLEELAKEQKRKAVKKKEELEQEGLTAEDKKTIDNQEHSAASFLDFLEKARSGVMMPADVIVQYAHYFQDDLTLDNMPRMQLVNMCKYMSIPPYGSDAFLRFQLRHRIRSLKEDDQRILWEGIDSLTKMELREACQERGMRSTGLSKDAYKSSLQQWLDLSVEKNVPISLLIMSRTFFLREDMFQTKSESEQNLAGLADTISGLDKEVLNEVILDIATSEEKLSDPEIRKLKLEVLTQQNELIRKEQEAREAAAKKKEKEEQEKVSSSETEPSKNNFPVEKDDSTSVQSSTNDVGSDVTEAVSKESTSTETIDRDLSTEEMEALSSLLTDDPVSRERADFEKLKAALKGEFSPEKTDGESSTTADSKTKGSSPDAKATMASEAGFSEETVFTNESKGTSQAETEASSVKSRKPDIVKQDSEEDPIVARLKKRVEKMVDKIEVQISNVQVKIGDKLHFLDKDKDGVLTLDEMAEVLQQVLRREISAEEAMEIARTIDNNHDGIFTVDELMRWCDEHRLIKYVEEDRDADMDRVIEKHSSQNTDTKKEDLPQ